MFYVLSRADQRPPALFRRVLTDLEGAIHSALGFP
jgi:hypothetical protein